MDEIDREIKQSNEMIMIAIGLIIAGTFLTLGGVGKISLGAVQDLYYVLGASEFSLLFIAIGLGMIIISLFLSVVSFIQRYMKAKRF